MALIDPTTRSPGHLVLFYTANGFAHSMSCRFVTGVDLDNVALIATDADSLAAAVQNAMGNSCVITDFGVKDKNGRLVYRASLPTARVGLRAGGQESFSHTVTAVGAGNAIGAAYAHGQASLRFFTGNSYPLDPGRKTWSVDDVPALLEVQDNLNASLRYFADYYGQKADCRPLFPLQFNAHAQRTIGS